MFTVAVAVLSPVLHKYVSPPLALRSILVTLHVNTVVEDEMLAVGAVVFVPMVMLFVPVQPLLDVTVTV